jgi:putative chitinase
MGLFDWFRRKNQAVPVAKAEATIRDSLIVDPPLFEEPAAPVAPVVKVPDPISTKAPTLITLDQLRRGMGITRERADYWDDWLNEAMSLYQINTKARIAAFLAQVGHESMRLARTSEIWGPTKDQRRYEGRKDLGNVRKGDGSRFRGHGLIQTTGRFNHRRVTQRLRARFPNLGVPDFEAEPQKLTLPRWAALSAADYWDMIGGNAMADAGQFKLLTRRINGGYNGLADRQKLWDQFKQVL